MRDQLSSRCRPGSETWRVALALVALALAVSTSGLLLRVDHLLFDIGQRLSWRAAPDDVLIVAIDKDSLERIGRWPWARDVHARLLDNLCAGHPKAIGLDIAFAEPGPDPQADALLAAAIKRCANVLLPLIVETPRSGGQILESPPIPSLARAAAGLGRVGVRLDEDGIARSVDLWEGVGAPTWPLLAQEILRVARQLPEKALPPPPADARRETEDTLVRSGVRRLNFIGPPGSVPRLSYAQVLNSQTKPEMLAGKVVLIGVTAVGLGDFLPTPVSALGQPMPGVEVLANALLSMRDGRLIRSLPELPTLALNALLALAPLLWLPRLMPLSGLLASVAWFFALAGFSALLPGFAQLWFAPTGALIAGLSAFPLWSWRRLEAARQHLDRELLQLQATLPGRDSSTAPATPPAGMRGMGFEQRIAWVQAAQHTMQGLEIQRNETLAFISHDLRAPLASAVQYLESTQKPDPEHLLQTLRRASDMAQAFLSLSRAEMLETRQMHELDLTAVLHQAADELYPLAQRKMLRIDRQLPDDPVWIKGDFDLLERAAINLLQNALAHSPTNMPIALGIDRQAGTVRFWVENRGSAIPPEQMAKLFQRFSKGSAQAANAGGTGLGLYFVRTVAGKHGGSSGATCLPEEKIRFWVDLPCAEPARVKSPA